MVAFTVPIPAFPSPLKFKTFVPPAINEPVSAPAHPIPVSESVVFGVKVGSVAVGVTSCIPNLLLAFPLIAALLIS